LTASVDYHRDGPHTWYSILGIFDVDGPSQVRNPPLQTAPVSTTGKAAVAVPVLLALVVVASNSSVVRYESRPPVPGFVSQIDSSWWFCCNNDNSRLLPRLCGLAEPKWPG